MASVNKVILLGNLGRDPETRTFPNGDLVTNITIATTEKWKDKNTNEAKEATEWHRISFGGRLAEIAQQYLHKGDPVYVEGALRTRKYTDKDGIEKFTTDIRAHSMQLLGSRPDSGQRNDGQQRQAPQQQAQPQQGGRSAPAQNNNQQRQQPAQQQQRPAPQSNSNSGFDDMDDDIPF